MEHLSSLTIGQQAILLTAFASLLYLITTRVLRPSSGRRSLPLPPSPPGYPVIGSLLPVLSATKKHEVHLLFEQWARDLGPLYRVKVGLFTQYMVNSDYAAKTIFDKHARDSANRMPAIVSRDHISNGLSLLTLDATDPRWKLQRKVTWSHVGSIPRANDGVQYLHYETLKFLHEVVSDSNLQTSSSALWGAVKRYTYSNFATQMFGLEIPNLSDHAIEYIHETAAAQVLATLPGYHIVDVLPVLDSLPLIFKPWERNGRERFRRDLAWVTEKLQRVQNMPDRSLIKDSLLCKIVEDDKHLGFESKEEGAFLCMQLTIAGSDTSQASTWAFLEAMLRYPEVQEKAQQLVDQTVGDRVPNFEDHESIPYIRCLVKETLRWRPPVALGQPHMTTADIEFEGMTIPKGSSIQLNSWALQHDPARYEDPERFWPERFEDDKTSTMESLNADYRKRDHFAFGAGRRVCSGYNVAERSLTIAIIRILWAFDVKMAPRAKLPLNCSDWPGLLPANPGEDMPVVLVPRKGRVAVIEKEFAAARAGRALFESIDGK